MTYFAFLGWFIGIPLLLLFGINWWDRRRGIRLPDSLRGWPVSYVIMAHIVVAVLYTTPWDNYLVATRVWWYDPALVTGLVLGWVPIEEYTFFVLQTLLVGLWLLVLARRITDRTDSAVPAQQRVAQVKRIRTRSAFAVGLLWIGSVILLFSGWKPGTYLGLELIWALPPIIFQLAFGADILWSYRRTVFWAIAVPAIYLSATDTIAIGSGTWTIDPAQSTGILIGTLPVEEFIFFLLTTVLVVFGTILVLAHASHARTPAALRQWMARFAEQPILAEEQMAHVGIAQSESYAQVERVAP